MDRISGESAGPETDGQTVGGSAGGHDGLPPAPEGLEPGPRGWLQSPDSRIAAAIFALAVVVRVVYILQSRSSPAFLMPIVDAEVYDRMARTLAQKHLLEYGFFWQPFFYPFFLAVVYFFTGSSILAAKLIQGLVGGFTCVLTYYLAARLLGRRGGVIAGVILALCGPVVFFETELLATGLAAFFSVALLLLFLHAREAPQPRACFALGVVGALSVLTRPTFLPFFAAGCIWLAVALVPARLPWKRLGSSAGGIAAGFLVMVGPIGLMAWQYTGKFSFLPSSGGVNVYIGNNPHVRETLTIRPGWDWERLNTMPEREDPSLGYQWDEQAWRKPLLEREKIKQRRQWAKQRFFYGKVADYARSEPISFLAGLGAKAFRFISSREVPRNVDIYLMRRHSGLMSLLTWKVGGFGFPFGLILPLAVVGLVSCRRLWPGVFWLFVALYPLALILVFVAGRYRVAVVPALVIAAAGGCLGLGRLIRQGRRLRLGLAAVCMGGVAAVGMLAGPFCEELPNYQAELYANIGTIHRNHNRLDEAEKVYKEAMKLRPDYADVCMELGTVALLRGRLAEAAAYYEKALEMRPDNAKAYHNLGVLAWHQGRTDRAMELFGQTLRIHPYNPKTRYFLALALLQKGRVDEARGALLKEAQLESEPRDLARVHWKLGDIYGQEGQPAAAIEHYERALQFSNRHVGALRGLAWILSTDPQPANRDGAKAVALAERAQQLQTSAETLDVLGAAYAEASRFTEAVQTAKKALASAQLSGGQAGRIEEIRRRISLYQSRQPFRTQR